MPKNVIETPFISRPTTSKLPYYLDYRYCRQPQKRVPWLFTQSTPSLRELCSRVVNKLPPPNSWNWTIEEVGDWVEHVLGFPQYRAIREAIFRYQVLKNGGRDLEDDKWSEICQSISSSSSRNCFEQNYISGRKLILVDASTLPKWNITDFGHITVITAAVRDLLNIEQEYFARSITLPPRDSNTMVLIYKRPTGTLIDRKPKTRILEDVRYLMIRPKPPVNLWDRTNYEKPKFPKERVGLWRIRHDSPLFACKSSSMGDIIEETKSM